jgi:hypothetical protein
MPLKRIYAAWRDGGVRLAVRVLFDRIYDRVWETRFGIDTAGLTPIETLVPGWYGLHDYFPSALRDFRHLMEQIDIHPRRDVFVDIGSGKGRALLMAAQYPFKRVIGIEISEELNRAARLNLARWSGHLACDDIDICTADAAGCVIPRDATVFYFYNPFRGASLRAAIEAIALSHACAPRRIWVVFNNTRHFRAIEPEFPWLCPVARPVLEHECCIYLVGADGQASGRRALNTSTLSAAAASCSV